MLKGIGKYVVVMKNVNSDVIEEAIFILKECNISKKKDVLKECEDIINRNSVNSKSGKGIVFRILMIIITLISLAASVFLTMKLL